MKNEESKQEQAVRMAANELYSAYSIIKKNELNIERVICSIGSSEEEATKLLNQMDSIKHKLVSVISRMTDVLGENDKNQYILE